MKRKRISLAIWISIVWIFCAYVLCAQYNIINHLTTYTGQIVRITTDSTGVRTVKLKEDNTQQLLDFEIKNVWQLGKFNSDEIYSKIKVGQYYKLYINDKEKVIIMVE
jgi:hypothetical protein